MRTNTKSDINLSTILILSPLDRGSFAVLPDFTHTQKHFPFLCLSPFLSPFAEFRQGLQRIQLHVTQELSVKDPVTGETCTNKVLACGVSEMIKRLVVECGGGLGFGKSWVVVREFTGIKCGGR